MEILQMPPRRHRTAQTLAEIRDSLPLAQRPPPRKRRVSIDPLARAADRCRIRDGTDQDGARLPTDEEREFLIAIDRYQRKYNRKFPTFREVLAVAHSLGYRRIAQPNGAA